MASFAKTRPDQYTQYTPQLGSELYGKALSKKDLDYQEGTKKVQSAIDSVAGLPVASDREREYLQGKIKGITTDINSRIGTDFSNANQTNTIAGHVSSISNDPIIQTAIQNVSTIKTGNERQKINQDKHGGATIANDYDWDNNKSEWLQNGKLGEAFGHEYKDYFDKQKYTDDYFAKKHPNQRVRFEFAGFDSKTGAPLSESKIYQWDAIKHTWEGLKQDEVAKEMEDLVSTSPELSRQLGLDAKYKYKDHNAFDYAYEIKNNQVGHIQRDQQLYNQYLVDLGHEKEGSDRWIQIHDKLDELTTDANKRATYLSTGLEEDMFRYHTDPSFQQSEQFRLYKDKWIHSQADLYAWGKDNAELIGDSPRKAWYEHQKLLQENRKMNDEEKKENFKEYMDGLKYKDNHNLIIAKIKKLGSAGKAPLNPSLSDIGINENQVPTSPYEKTQKELLTVDADLEISKNNHMHDVLGKHADGLMLKDPNGNYYPKDQPSKNIVNKYYADLKSAYDNGGLGPDGRPLLDAADMDYFGGIAESEVNRNLTQQTLVRGETAWKNYYKTNPTIQAIETKLNNFTPVNVGPNEFVTEADIRKFATVRGVAHGKAIDAGDPDIERIYLAQAGFSQNKISYLLHNSSSDLISGLEELPITKDKFLSDFVSGGVKEGIVYINQQEKGLFGADTKLNNVIKRNAIQIAIDRIPGKKEILSASPDKFTLTYTQDPVTKKYSLLVRDPNEKSTNQIPPIPLTDNEVKNLQLEDIVTIDPVLSRISKNWDIGANTGDPDKGGMTFKNSLHTNIVVTDPKINGGNPTDIRYGVEYKKSTKSFYVTLFGKDLKTNKEVRVTQLPGQKDWGTAKMKLGDLLARYTGVNPYAIETPNQNNSTEEEQILNEEDNQSTETE